MLAATPQGEALAAFISFRTLTDGGAEVVTTQVVFDEARPEEGLQLRHLEVP